MLLSELKASSYSSILVRLLRRLKVHRLVIWQDSNSAVYLLFTTAVVFAAASLWYWWGILLALFFALLAVNIKTLLRSYSGVKKDNELLNDQYASLLDEREHIVLGKTMQDLLLTFEKQIEGSRQLGDLSVNSLTQTFSRLENLLDVSIGLAKSATSELGDESSGFLAQCQHDLQHVINAMNGSMQAKEEILTVIASVSDAANELTSQTESINKISKEISLLSLNASIEAARAGDVGSGFAVVAERVRELSVTTAASTDLIMQRMSHLVDAVERGKEHIVSSQENDKLMLEQAEQRVQVVLDKVLNVNGKFSGTIESMDASAQDIKKQVASATLDFQFQDRVSQKLGHLVSALQLLRHHIMENNKLSEGQLLEVSNALYASYTMKEERDAHAAPVTESASKHDTDDITFF